MNKGIKEYSKILNHNVGNAAEVFINVNKAYPNMHINIPLYKSSPEDYNLIDFNLMFTLSEKDKTNYNLFGKGIKFNIYKTIEYYESHIFISNLDGTKDRYNFIGINLKIPEIKAVFHNNKTYFSISGNAYVYLNEENNSIFIKDDSSQGLLIDSSKNVIQYNGLDFSGPFSVNKFPEAIKYNKGIVHFIKHYDTTTYLCDDSDQVLATLSHPNGRIVKIEIKKSQEIIFEINLTYDVNDYLKIISYSNTKMQYQNLFIYEYNKITIKDLSTNYQIVYTYDSDYKVKTFKDGYDVSLYGGSKTSIYYQDYYTKITNYKNQSLHCYFDEKQDRVLKYEMDHKARTISYKYDNYKRLISKSSMVDSKQDSATILNNCVSNGYFTKYEIKEGNDIVENWIPEIVPNTDIGIKVISDSSHPFSNVLGLNTLSLNKSVVYQDIAITGNINNPIILALWAKHGSYYYDHYATVTLLLKYKGNIVLTKSVDYYKRDYGWDIESIELNPENIYDSVTIRIQTLNSGFFKAVQLYQRNLGSTFNYDNLGNIDTKIIGNNIMNVQYNDNNSLKETLGPNSSLFNYLYDDKNNIKKIKAANNLDITFDYDNRNRVSNTLMSSGNKYINTRSDSFTYAGIPDIINRVYDDVGNLSEYRTDNKYNLVKEALDAEKNISTFLYYPDDYIKNLKVSNNSKTEFSDITYTYTDKKLIKTLELSNGVKYEYAYDTPGRLLSISVGNALTLEKLINYSYYDDYDYDGNLVYTNKIEYIEYESGDKYKYLYDNEDRVDEIQFKKRKSTDFTTIFKYTYNIYGRLIKYNDYRILSEKNYVYNNNNLLVETQDRDNIISYDYDKLGEINNKKIINSNKNIIQSFDPLKRSKGMCPENFFSGYKYQNLKPLIYSCFFYEEKLINNVIVKSLDANVKSIKSDGSIEEYSIPPSKGSDLVPTKDGIIPCIDYNDTLNRLSYKVDTYSHFPEPCQTIMFWFKPLYIQSGSYLFGTGDTISNSIGVYMNTYGQLILKLVDCNGVIYDKILSTSSKCNLNEWNFFALTWYNRNDDGRKGECQYELVLNSEYKIYPKSANNIFVGTGTSCYLNIGSSNNNGDYPMNIKVTALAFTNGYNLSQSKVSEYYRISSEYIFNNIYIDENIQSFEASGSNLYNIDNDGINILNNYDIIPLHNSLTSLRGINPVFSTNRVTVDYDRDRNFNYNNIIKRYTYVADGANLVYDFGLSNSGFLMLKSIITGNIENQYIFQNKDTSGKLLGLFRKNGILYLEIEGQEPLSTGITLLNNVWEFISLSWNFDRYDAELGNVYSFVVKCGNFSYSINKYLSFKFNKFNTSIGRRMDGRNYQNDIYTDALLGQIEMLIYKDNYVNINSINQLREKMKVNSYAKQFDAFGRIVKEYIMDDGVTKLNHSFNYHELHSTDGIKVTNQIEKEIIKTNPTIMEYSYSYDGNRNIIGIKEGDIQLRVYNYDYKKQLKYEYICNRNCQMFYNYDKNGNIKSKTTYSNTEDTPLVINYKYDDNWKDRLISFGPSGKEKDIVYNDNAFPGNPTLYGNKEKGIGIEYFWEGTRLVKLLNSDPMYGPLYITYNYNDEGLRTQKIISLLPTNYFYEGSNLIKEETGSNYKYYIYDENSNLYGLIIDNKTYYYIKDIKGLIVGLIDTNGVIVVKYEYDAFGNILSIKDTSNTNLGKKNPFIYKGYYYDFETSLYYCNSRYYNPEWGRFLQAADVSALNPSSINGLNLYTFANNNPVSIKYRSYNVGSSVGGGMVNSITGVGSSGGSIYSGSISSLVNRNLPPVPGWVENVMSISDVVSSLVSPVRTSVAIFKYTNLWDIMRLDGIIELPGALSKTMAGIGWGLSILGGAVVGYEKYASGASLSSSIAGGVINAGIGVGIMYASSAIATGLIGTLAMSSLVIPGGVLVVGGALLAVGLTIGMDYLVTEVEFFGNTIEGHLNDAVDWLIWWD